MRGVPRELRGMMRSFRPTALQYFSKLIFPAIMPNLITSWKINLSLAIRVVTIAELVGAVTGIGHQLAVAQELFSVADVFAWTLVLVAMLFLLEGVVGRIERASCDGGRERSAAHYGASRCARSSARPHPDSRGGDRRTRSRHRSARGGRHCRPDRLWQVDILRSDDWIGAPTAGSIVIGGKTPYGDFDHFRGQIATVFQQDRLLPWRSALDNARLPLELIGLSEVEQRKRAMAWLSGCGLASFTGAYPHELSGGMRQRVAIARAFVVAAEHSARRRGVRPSRRGHRRRIARNVSGARARMRQHRHPDHPPARGSDRGRRPHCRARPRREALADIHVERWPAGEYAVLREAIQATLQSNEQNLA